MVRECEMDPSGLGYGPVSEFDHGN